MWRRTKNMVVRLCFFIGHMVWVSTSYTTHESYDLSYQEEEDGDDKKVPSVGTLGQLSFVTSSNRREGFCHKSEWERGVFCAKSWANQSFVKRQTGFGFVNL